MERTYIAIDLKSFYASVECIAREMDPLTTNLVVADASRTEKTICLAVSPALKGFGIPGRPRLFEVSQKIRELNALRQAKAPGRKLGESSVLAPELHADPTLAIDYIVAKPRMSFYMECSTLVYSVYLKYIAPEDIHVYSIDEVFMDVTAYLNTYRCTARELAMKIILDVLETTGVTATAGIGTNMYLYKVAMDIVAKHIEPDRNGVRIAQLDEMSYRKTLWDHRPLTDFWRIGRGYAKKLEQRGLFTMGDIARCSLENEDLLYKLFGINAELLIDHAWGWEPCTIADIKNYKPMAKSLGSGQVLHEPYPCEKAKLIVREMTDLLVLDLVDKGLTTNQMVLTIGYDQENLSNPKILSNYRGQITTDHYGRQIPQHAHGTANLSRQTSSTKLITEAVMALFDRIADPNLLVRRINICAAHILPEGAIPAGEKFLQMDLFSDPDKISAEEADLEREKQRQKAILSIQKKYGKNALLKGMNLREGATAKDRNRQIGGHKA